VAGPSAPPPPPNADVVERHRRVVVAGHKGDHETVDAFLNDPAEHVRQAALSALHRQGRCEAHHLRQAFADPDPLVRARAAELAALVPDISPAALLDDPVDSVVEIAAFACGEMTWQPRTAPIAALSAIATNHTDALCRESAAAALGAIGDPAGFEAVLAACDDRVTVRRRATLALAAFDDPRADEALRRALDDKDWQVRQAAEDLLEVGRVLDAPPDPDAFAD